MEVEAGSLRRSGGGDRDRTEWTIALLNQFRNTVSEAMRGGQAPRKRLEGLLLNAQQFAFQNPFVSCSLSYSVALGFANAGDTPGYVLTMEGPWDAGLDFEFIRKLYGLYTGPFDYLQEYGLPQRLEPPFTLVRVDKVDPWNPAASERVFP